MRPALRLLAAPVSGALLAAAFPTLDIGPLALVALVPLLLVVETARPRRAAALGYLAGLTFFGLHLLWIAEFLSWTGGVAWLAWGALSAIQAAAFAAFFALVPATRPLGAWRLLVLPAAWAVLELLRAYHPIGGFPWGLLALSQHDAGLLLPLARVVGGFGLAAVIVAVNLAVAFWLRALWAGGQEGPRWRRLAPLVGLPLLVAGLLGARLVVPQAPAPSGPPLDVVVVQAGLRGGHGLAQGQTTEQVFANHVRRTETLALTPGPPPDLVVWGEGAADADPLSNPDRQAAVARAAAAAKAPILLGATTRVDQDHLATEALLYTPEGQLADRYQKRRLVPFGEFVPFGSVLGRLIPATREGVPYDKVPGQRLEPLLIDGVRVGPLICWESAYPGDARQLTARRRPGPADHDQQRLVRDRGRAPPAPGRRAAAGGRDGPDHRPGRRHRDQRGHRPGRADQLRDRAVPGHGDPGPGRPPERPDPVRALRAGDRGRHDRGGGGRARAGRGAVVAAA